MSTVSDVLENKGHEVWTIDASKSIFEATTLMEDKSAGALAVTSGNTSLAGIISERDCARAVILRGLSATETTVKDVMTRDVFAVKADTPVDECLHLMAHHQIRHLPVTENSRLVGFLTGGDLMKFVVREQSMTIEALDSFIHLDEGGEG